MSTFILAAALSVLGAVLAFCLVALSGNTERTRRAITRLFAAPGAAIKRKKELDDLQKAVFDKADRVQEMVSHETKVLSFGGPPPSTASASSVPEPPDENETAIMRAVSKKVRKIQDLSDRI